MRAPGFQMLHSTEVSQAEYRGWMDHLERLPMVALVTTGRTGSDYLQSLFDGHPEVLTFNGALELFREFVNVSVTMRVPEPDPRDVMDELIGRMIQAFVSRYDHEERKDQLGPARDQSFRIDTEGLKRHALGLLSGRLSTRRLLLAVTGAYHLSLGRTIPQTGGVLSSRAWLGGTDGGAG